MKLEPIKDFDSSWPEYIIGTIGILGLVLGIAMRNPAFSYMSVIVLGFICARVFYMKKGKTKLFPTIMSILTLLFLYILSNFGTNRLVLLILVILSFSASYILHKKKIFTIFKSENFLK